MFKNPKFIHSNIYCIFLEILCNQCKRIRDINISLYNWYIEENFKQAKDNYKHILKFLNSFQSNTFIYSIISLEYYFVFILNIKFLF